MVKEVNKIWNEVGSMQNISTHLKIGSNCMIKNRVYFMNITFNGLFYMDMKDFSIHFVHRFSYEPNCAARLSINGSLAYNNDIYFFPCDTNVILRYNIVEQQEEAIPIQDCYDEFIKISTVVRRKDMVYMFPNDLKNGIYVFDLKNQKAEKDKKLSSLFCSEFRCSKGNILYDDKDCILISRYGGNQLLKVNLVTKQVVAKKVVEGIQIYFMCFDGKHYWILPMESTDIYEWDMENDFFKKYINEHVEWRRRDYIGQRPYANLIFLEDEILVLNCYVKNILRIDKEKKTIGNPVEYPEGFGLVNSQFDGWPVYARYTTLEDKVLLYPYAGNMLLIYDKKTKRIFGRKLLVSEKEVFYLHEVLKANLTGKEMCIENDDFETLEEFVNAVEEDDEKRRITENKRIGNVVWSNLKIE